MQNNQSIIIAGPTIYTENAMISSGSIIIQDDLIADVSASHKNPTIQFPTNYHLVPGFIDCHVHGAMGHDVMDGTQDALQQISLALAKEGTTSFLATTMTAESNAIGNALVNVRDFIDANAALGAEILGMHLEGPFISPEKNGAQPSRDIVNPDVDLMKHLDMLSDHKIKLVTLAPEQKNAAELIQYLTQQKIVASIGHTNATYEETLAAIHLGCTHATHLFNAMRSLQQRDPGPITAALLSEKIIAEVIVDGVHLHPAIVNLCLRLKGKDNLILVSDAMRAKCLADGCYTLAGQNVEVNSGRAQLSDGTLAGSVLKMSTALKNVMEFTNCSLSDAIHMTSVNAAKQLNVFDRKGSVSVGKDADLVVLDENLKVVWVMCRGKVVSLS